MLIGLLWVSQALGEGLGSAAAETAKVSVNGIDIGYRIHGQGDPLLMIMGYAGVMDVWAPALVKELSRSYRVILFDNRGMGYSSGADTDISIELMASDAAGLLTALDIESAHVLGWSMGSMVAQELALSSPGRVRKVVLYGTTIDTKPVLAAVDRMGVASPEVLLPMLFPAPWLKANPDAFKRLPVPSIAPLPAVVTKQREAMADWSSDIQGLSSMRKDVLLVSGDEDNVTPPAQSLRLAGIIKGAWLARFRGAGHWLMYQAPEDLAHLVQGFLSIREDLLMGRSSIRQQAPAE